MNLIVSCFVINNHSDDRVSRAQEDKFQVIWVQNVPLVLAQRNERYETEYRYSMKCYDVSMCRV